MTDLELREKVEKYCGEYAPMTLGRHRIEAVRQIMLLIQAEREAEGRDIAETIISKLRLTPEYRPVDLDIIQTLIATRYQPEPQTDSNPICRWCGKLATTQTEKGKEAELKGHLPQNWGYYCDKCYEEGYKMEMEAIHG